MKKLEAKNGQKKLTLKRERIRLLTDDEIGGVGGGSNIRCTVTATCGASCERICTI